MNTHPVQSILSITLNPALDFATSVPGIVADQKLYCAPARVDPGGGGVNVARAIRSLGGQARAFVVVGGATGARLLDLLGSEGVQTLPFHISGETRFSFAVTDAQTGEQLRFSLPGDPLSALEGETLLAAINDAVPPNAFVVVSGGVAPGLPVGYPQQIQAEIAQKGARFVIDTSKSSLETVIAAPIAPASLLRIDRHEASRVAGHSMDALHDNLDFAASLVARGVAHHVVTGRGAEGSLLVSKEHRLMCRAPQVAVKSKIGAGDAFVGAMVMAMARNDPAELALRWGVAAACATVSTEGTKPCTLEDATALLDGCIVTAV